MTTITREQAQKIIEAADEVISALAGTNEDVHPGSDNMLRLWDDLNDRYAPPEKPTHGACPAPSLVFRRFQRPPLRNQFQGLIAHPLSPSFRVFHRSRFICMLEKTGVCRPSPRSVKSCSFSRKEGKKFGFQQK